MTKKLKVLHLVTQRGQPYGSVRYACERCGDAVVGTKSYYTTEETDYDQEKEALRTLGYVTCEGLSHEERA